MRTRLPSPPWCSLDGQPFWAGGRPPRSRCRPVPAAALRHIALRTAVSPLVCSAAIILHAPSAGISTKNHVRSSRRPSRTPPARIARAGAGTQRASDSMWCVLSLPYTPSCHDAVLQRRRMRSLSARTWRADRAAGSGVHWQPENAGRGGALDADQRRSSGHDRLVVARCLLLHGSLRGLRSSLGTYGPQRFYRERSVRAPLGSPLWGRKRVAIASGGG